MPQTVHIGRPLHLRDGADRDGRRGRAGPMGVAGLDPLFAVGDVAPHHVGRGRPIDGDVPLHQVGQVRRPGHGRSNRGDRRAGERAHEGEERTHDEKGGTAHPPMLPRGPADTDRAKDLPSLERSAHAGTCCVMQCGPPPPNAIVAAGTPITSRSGKSFASCSTPRSSASAPVRGATTIRFAR